MAYDNCPICGTKMTGFTTLFCPKEAEHPQKGELTLNETFALFDQIMRYKPGKITVWHNGDNGLERKK